MSALLEVQDLNYYYGNIHTIKGITLEVNEGEMVALIGANGAGKTTTLQTISGLTNARGVHGRILFDGQEIQKMRGNIITRLGLSQVMEGRHIFPKLTVEENLQVGAYLRNDTKRIRSDISDLYKLFPRLLERKTSLGGHLSGGEQQMLAIARALILHPRMLLLDEPSLGLAPLIVKEIFEAIKRVNAEGMTILFVEQNSKIALETASRGYVLQTGEIVLSDTSENLLNNEEVKKAYLGEN